MHDSEYDHSHSDSHGSHSHSHSHAHSHSAGAGGKLRWFSLLLALYIVAEVVGGYASGSLALLADAGHMAIDLLAVVLGLFAMWVSRLPPSKKNTFGYYRAEILVALVNGALLVAAAIGLIVEAVKRLGNPHPIDGGLMGAVALGGLAINLIGLFLLKDDKDHNLNMRGVWLHVLTDTLGSVGAVAAAGGVMFLGWTWADPAVSVLIAAFILYGSWNLLKESVNVLLEGVPREIDMSKLRGELSNQSGVLSVHDLHVWTMTNGMHSLSAHIRIEEKADSSRLLAALLNMLEKQYKIDHVTLQLEPPSFLHERGMHIHS